MNPRCPTVTLSSVETEKLVALVRERGHKAAARSVGIYDIRTLSKAYFGDPISRGTADLIRHSLDRI